MFYGAVKGPVFLRLFCVALRIFRRAEDGTLFSGGRLIYEARGAHVPAAKPPELCGAFAPQACRQARGAPPPPVYGAISAPPGTMPRSAASRSLYEKKSRKGTPRVPRSPLYAPYCGCTRSTRVLSTY